MNNTRRRMVPALILALAVTAACSNSSQSRSGTSLQAPSPQGSPSVEPSRPAASSSPGGLLLSPVPSPAGPAALAAPGLLEIKGPGAALAASPGGPAAGRLRGGVTAPFTAVEADWVKITTPCELSRWVPTASVSPLPRPQIILDPGHGGRELGAVGPSGLSEKTINTDVAIKATALLAKEGITAAVTRVGDYRATLAFRTSFAAAAKPQALVSIHHNADPDGPMERPGTETYYQMGSADSKRLAGLIYEETVRALSPLAAKWVGDTDAGAKWRPGRNGADYYGILRQARQANLTAVLAELAFVSNPSEEALLAKEETRRLEAGALAKAVTRYLRTKDPGSGFTTPYPRKEPAGPGGGRSGCTDPG